MSEIARSGTNNLAGAGRMEVVLAIGLTASGALNPGFSWTRIYYTPGTLKYEHKTGVADTFRTVPRRRTVPLPYIRHVEHIKIC